MTLKFENIGRVDVYSSMLLIYIPQPSMNLPSDFMSETVTELHGPSVLASFDSTHFQTNCLNKILPSHKLMERVNNGSLRFLCLKLHQVMSAIKPAWKVASHLKDNDKKKILF